MCKIADTRRKVDDAFERLCMEVNEPLINRIFLLRQEEATLLGYESHAHFNLFDKMAKNPETVFKFLDELNDKVQPLLKKDLAEFARLKKIEADQFGIPFDPVIHSHDYRYYYNQILETQYDINQQDVQEYFPLNHVLPGILATSVTLLTDDSSLSDLVFRRDAQDLPRCFWIGV